MLILHAYNKKPYKEAQIQEPIKTLSTANGGLMETTKTLKLLMPKWPVAARKAYLVMNTKNNLIAVS